jgi:hypothetical protein
MSSYEFPYRLPNPENLYTPDAVFHPHFPLTVPRQPAVTFPALFPTVYGGVFFPIQGISYLTMGEMIHMQALFAARQFLTARCVQHGLEGVSGENPFISTDGSIGRLYSELSLLSATLGAVSSEMMLGVRRATAQMAYQEFICDIYAYAPWLPIQDGALSLHRMVTQSQARLVYLRNSVDEYRTVQHLWSASRQARMAAEREERAMEPPERERSGVY